MLFPCNIPFCRFSLNSFATYVSLNAFLKNLPHAILQSRLIVRGLITSICYNFQFCNKFIIIKILSKDSSICLQCIGRCAINRKFDPESSECILSKFTHVFSSGLRTLQHLCTTRTSRAMSRYLWNFNNFRRSKEKIALEKYQLRHTDTSQLLTWRAARYNEKIANRICLEICLNFTDTVRLKIKMIVGYIATKAEAFETEKFANTMNLPLLSTS